MMLFFAGLGFGLMAGMILGPVLLYILVASGERGKRRRAK